MKYKYAVWYRDSKTKDLKYLETVTVEAESERDAIPDILRKVSSQIVLDEDKR